MPQSRFHLVSSCRLRLNLILLLQLGPCSGNLPRASPLQVTTGAGGDLQQVERMARAMVTQFGMSDVGSLAIDDGGFMGPNYSEELSASIDKAIKDISDDGYRNALNILMTNRACLDRVAEELTELETMTGDRLRQIIAEYVEIPAKLAAV